MFLIFLPEVRKQVDHLRGEDCHVGQEKELQFDMQLIGGTVSYFKMYGGRKDFLLVWRKRHLKTET